jgi:hypothetical protein
VSAATPNLDARDQALYEPFGACLGCPMKARCHPARQRASDALGIGRHSACAFFAAFRRTGLVPAPARGRGVLSALTSFLTGRRS